MPAPVVQARVSLGNNFSTTVAVLTASSAQADWPATNVLYPHQPFVPWKTLDTTANNLIVDFVLPRVLDLFMAVDVNYTSAAILVDSDAAFAPPDYSSGVLTIHRNPWNTRHTLCYLFSPSQTKRHLLYNIPSQATTDGLSYFRTGGLWVGQVTALPRDIRWDERPSRLEPHLDVPLIGGGTQRLSTGRPYVELQAQRIGTTLRSSPGTGDELGAWLEIDRLMSRVGHFAYYFNRGNTSEGFIVRKMNESAWNVNQVVSEDALILHEAVGP